MKRLQLVEDEYNLIHDCSDLEVAQARLLGREEMKMLILDLLKTASIGISNTHLKMVIHRVEAINCEGETI